MNKTQELHFLFPARTNDKIATFQLRKINVAWLSWNEYYLGHDGQPPLEPVLVLVARRARADQVGGFLCTVFVLFGKDLLGDHTKALGSRREILAFPSRVV